MRLFIKYFICSLLVLCCFNSRLYADENYILDLFYDFEHEVFFTDAQFLGKDIILQIDHFQSQSCLKESVLPPKLESSYVPTGEAVKQDTDFFTVMFRQRYTYDLLANCTEIQVEVREKYSGVISLFQLIQEGYIVYDFPHKIVRIYNGDQKILMQKIRTQYILNDFTKVPLSKAENHGQFIIYAHLNGQYNIPLLLDFSNTYQEISGSAKNLNLTIGDMPLHAITPVNPGSMKNYNQVQYLGIQGILGVNFLQKKIIAIPKNIDKSPVLIARDL